MNYRHVLKYRTLQKRMEVVPVNFSSEHKAMLGNCKMLLEKYGGYIAINSKFDKLITSLRTAVEKGEGGGGILDYPIVEVDAKRDINYNGSKREGHKDLTIRSYSTDKQ